MMNSRHRERKYNTTDNDRLLRALSQPVQAWDKKWTQHSASKTLQTYKWVKSERVIEFEPEEESGDEAVAPMETDQPSSDANAEVKATNIDTDNAKKTDNIPASQQRSVTSSTTQQSTVTTNTVPENKNGSNTNSNKILSIKDNSIPGGPSSLLTNKTISSVQQQEDVNDDDDDQRSQTPKLNDISDTDADKDDNDEDDIDSINDPSKHPALAPHAEARMTDDDMTIDSVAATPQDTSTTAENTPMPVLDDDQQQEDGSMEVDHQQPHPLSQEILVNENNAVSHTNKDAFQQQQSESTKE
ncbi:hypothetical protein BDF20DRAFT_867036 [Mycotypha africana]|uniref:uncharacterized protein n=1 Tax=Mycotypha africana TaxID=64632 RepID=UPI0023018320|nr:uncharacterized protein BDF20DRAFT_867036 [Mycotypha africana]KAI8982450.1 hypothetical protein BDF20DRAFT_867036 [Mycotypha africana]